MKAGITCLGKKIERLRSGKPPRVLDLFSGCGGLSLGFMSAGFEIAGNIENDPVAAKTFALNFYTSRSEEFQKMAAKSRDIEEMEPAGFINELYPGVDPALAIDVVIGGPPCQAFARIGRAKLREVARKPDAFKHDRRSEYYLKFLEYVKKLHPIAILMENVPDILNYAGCNIPQKMCDELEELGYLCSYTLLNAVFYGVPQMRERMFLIGYVRELGVQPVFPEPTNWIEIPSGYNKARKVVLRKAIKSKNYVEPPQPHPGLKKAVTVKQAIGDLPVITGHLNGGLKRGIKKLDNFIPYADNVIISDYVRLMRNWPCFENNGGICDHIIRYLPRDYPVFKRMRPGEQYPEAYNHAMNLFKEKLEALRAAGEIIEEGSDRYRQLLSETVPPYDPGKFPNKWRKLDANMPSHTLTAHLGKDSYSHIHYDDSQARTISVREAARLQSFPDGFRFEGKMNAAFHQIGNAVPPLLAYRIAISIYATLREAVNTNNRSVV